MGKKEVKALRLPVIGDLVLVEEKMRSHYEGEVVRLAYNELGDIKRVEVRYSGKLGFSITRWISTYCIEYLTA